MASARKKSNSSAPSPGPDRRNASGARFAVCVKNDDYLASLELRKLYRVLTDPFADEHKLLRVVDESGEDYLYPRSYFLLAELPSSVERALAKIA